MTFQIDPFNHVTIKEEFLILILPSREFLTEYYRPCGLESCLTTLLPNSEELSLEEARCLSDS